MSALILGHAHSSVLLTQLLSVLLVVGLMFVVATSLELMNRIQLISVIAVLLLMAVIALAGLTTMTPANLFPVH